MTLPNNPSHDPNMSCHTGVPQSVASATLTATYNDLASVRAMFEANKGQIAGVILEPVVGNSGFIPPTQEFLQVGAVNMIRKLNFECLLVHW